MKGLEIICSIIAVISAVYIGIIQPLENILIDSVFDTHFIFSRISSALIIIFTSKLISKLLRKEDVNREII